MEIFKIIILSLSALMLIFAGLMRLLKPIKSYCLKAYSDNPEIKLEGAVDLFNEMRGAGAFTILGGLVISLGAFISQFTLTSFAVATVIFIGFAIGRLLSMSLDGRPNKDLIQGTTFEIIFGGLNVVGLISTLT